jgi:allophanate hydrolase
MIEESFSRIREEGVRPIWISLANEKEAVARAKDVDRGLPLAGVPFAVKDNFDVAGMPTTAGCPTFAYVPARTATVVQRLLDAGAILIGKTNMDQFATGLVGTRSPYGACSSVYDSRYISGGSSSGSAVAVAKALCTFSLGTDTAGSGRVPAAFNNLVGLKPTRGLLSSDGVVPACRSLDCVSIFAKTASEARAVWKIARGYDSAAAGAAPWLGGSFRFGVPDDSQLKFFGDDEAPRLFRRAQERLASIGGVRTTIDFTVFREAAELLYSGPWVAERFAAVGEFLGQATEGVNEVVKNIILGGARYSAADAFRSMYRLETLKQRAAEEWAHMDVLLLPTTGTIYRHEAVAADPVRLNSNLGFYTNFVNLMDLAAIAVPARFRTNGLPFGVSLIGPAFSDEALLSLAEHYLGERADQRPTPGCVQLAVVGAHLSRQPLNHELTSRSARLVKKCRTASDYRLYALNGSVPPKPGLVRDPGFNGWGIEVEVWAIPVNQFGDFVRNIPPPLGIGTIDLDDGSSVKGFICEAAGTAGAEEITRFGSWRSYLAAGDVRSIGVGSAGND